MKQSTLNGTLLEYEVRGAGEPVLLVGTGPFADSFLPLLSEKSLTDRYRLIRYRQRGQVGPVTLPQPVSFAEHAADAAALLEHLGVGSTHVVGHSTGATIALQLAMDRSGLVHSLVLLEPPLPSASSAGDFFARVGPAVEAFGAGEPERAMRLFLTVVSGLEWAECRGAVEKHLPGGVTRALEGAGTFFGSYLPALGGWSFGPGEAAAISQPVLSVAGTETDRWFLEGGDLLRSWLSNVDECVIEGVGHLLHMQKPEPVARCVATFLEQHPME